MKRLLIGLALAALALPVQATAVVPPKNCGLMTVKGKRYQVKADQISCRKGREYAKRYLRTRSKPRGYTCRNVTKAKGRVNFFCYSGRRDFRAINR